LIGIGIKINYCIFKDPPNATVSMYEKGREQLEDVVVKLSRPRLASKDLTYDIKVIEGFYRFVELNRKLISADVVNWVADPRKEVAFDILITGYAPTYSEQVREYLTLLGLPMSKEESEDIVLPVYFAVKSRGLDGIAISTRSTGDLIQILRAAIEVPQEHNIAGVTIKYPEMGLIGKNLRIHSSKDKPGGAAVAVKYRDYWFYINDTDIRTKVFYQMLRILWSVSIAASADASAAPVLTIPVSR
jgi:hypothetical protein